MQSPCKDKWQPGLSGLKSLYPEVKQWVVYYKEPYMGTNQKHAKDSQEAIELLKKDGFHVLEFDKALEMARQGQTCAVMDLRQRVADCI
jgi:uncharacterized membrane protein